MVLKKVGRKVQTVVTKPFKKPKKHPNYITPPIASSSSPPPPPDQPQPMSPPPPPPSSYLTLNPRTTVPFLFPETNSTVLPDPSKFFPQNLLQTPLPTNSFFQNLALKNGDRPEYLHPYIINSADSALTVSYPTRHSQPNFIYQIFIADLIISAAKPPDQGPTPHVISSFDDLSLTLDFPSSNLRFFLVRGCPFITCSVSGKTELSISTVHAILSSSSNACKTKHTIKLNNNQTWLIYTSSPIDLTATSLSLLTSGGFTGILRIAALPDAGAEPVLDRFSSAYPVSGRAVMQRPFALEYKWEKKGWGDLLMLAHPLHLKLLSGGDDCDVTVLDGFKYRSIDGDLVGVVGDSWVLRPDPISITWHSIKGVSKEDDPRAEIVAALRRDVEGLGSISSTTSSYFYGKLIARAARLALIAEEVDYLDVVPAIRRFLKNAIEPWLDGSFGGNGFLYDGKWGGVVTKQGAVDSGADFGFGLYNDHHYHLGYFVYAISVLVKIDPAWGRKFKPQAYSLAADYLTLGRRPNARYTRLRCFDLYKLHSWAGGLTEFADGRNQESTSEAVNAYYSAALLGLAYGDTHLVANGSMLAALEIEAAKTWWHVRGGGDMYEEEFTRENRLVGVLWNNKRDNGLWFAPPEWKECRLGIQLLPIMPISEVLFSDIGFVRELVEWTLPALSREGVGEGWKGFVYALQGVYDKQGALEKIRNLTAYDDGDSLTNLLWWIHSRGGEEEEYGGGGHVCWARHYH